MQRLIPATIKPTCCISMQYTKHTIHDYRGDRIDGMNTDLLLGVGFVKMPHDRNISTLGAAWGIHSALPTDAMYTSNRCRCRTDLVLKKKKTDKT